MSIEDARAYILSNYVSNSIQEYYKFNNIKMSDELLAAILSASGSTFEELKIFPVFIKFTDNEKFKSELQNRVDELTRYIEEFKFKENPNIVYEIGIYIDKKFDSINGIYTNFDTAKSVGCKLKTDFIITKLRVYSSLDETGIDEDDGYVSNNELGRIYYIYNQDTQNFDRYICDCFGEYNKENFMDHYYGILHPFRYGNFVKDIKHNNYGIITYLKNDQEMYDHIEHIKSSHGDFTDEIVFIECVCDGKQTHSHVNVYDLELVKEEDVPNNIRNKLKAILTNSNKGECA